jgi:hypothetical protein
MCCVVCVLCCVRALCCACVPLCDPVAGPGADRQPPRCPCHPLARLVHGAPSACGGRSRAVRVHCAFASSCWAVSGVLCVSHRRARAHCAADLCRTGRSLVYGSVCDEEARAREGSPERSHASRVLSGGQVLLDEVPANAKQCAFAWRLRVRVSVSAAAPTRSPTTTSTSAPGTQGTGGGGAGLSVNIALPVACFPPLLLLAPRCTHTRVRAHVAPLLQDWRLVQPAVHRHPRPGCAGGPGRRHHCPVRTTVAAHPARLLRTVHGHRCNALAPRVFGC